MCLIVCDLDTSAIRRPGPDLGCCATENIKKIQWMNQFIQIYAQYDRVSLQKPVRRYIGSKPSRVLRDF